MLETRPATILDLTGFRLDPRQAERMPTAFAVLAELIRGHAPIAVLVRGQVVAFAGLTIVWPGRALAWCFLSAEFPRTAWVAATRAARRVLDGVDIRRVEADIADGFAPAGRWAQMLGFRHEGKMRAYWADGSDYHRWARVKA